MVSKINGRQINTHINIINKINQLIQIGIQIISITFVQTEGHLLGIPRQQIHDLIIQIPNYIEKIYIAVIGSSLWTNKLTIDSIYNSMIYFDQYEIVPAIIQDINGLVKGLCYMNKQSIEQTCQTSGHLQYVIKISLDCDSDSILIIVDSKNPFCHTGNYSCFNLQTSIKTNLSTLCEHITSKMNTNSYTGYMQRNSQLVLTKIMEEYWELVAASENNKIYECSDLFVHILIYLNSIGLSLEDISNELNKRRWTLKTLIQYDNLCEVKQNEILIAITNSKYFNKTDQFAENELGIKIIRYSNRNLLIEGEIINQEKFSKYFPHDRYSKLSLLPCNPKDMIWLLASKRITHIITYDTIIENYPKISTRIHQIIDPTIYLALISRQEDIIEPDKWTNKNKPLIASEYICQLTKYFQDNSIDSDRYHLDKISGSSEAFLINTKKYLLVDAIVHTGRTIQSNNLRIWNIIIPKGQIHIGLYTYSN
ncbi:unnamed protein product [Rotaria sp. Silwood1]|nr:unnamed protein product [Rotaria sp. Silwood1]